jgi:hypothetical protein
MKRKKKIFSKIILTFFLILIVIVFIFFFQFKKVIIEPQKYAVHLSYYFENKSPAQIYLNIKQIMINFPEIKKIEIRSNIFTQSLLVKLKISQMIANICDQQKCFFLDNFGEIIIPRVFEKKNLLRITSFLPIENNSTLNPEIKRFLTFLFEYANFRSLLLKEIKIYSNFDLGVIDSQNREFLFDPNKNLEEQFKKFHLILEDKKIFATRIDLRITKKIYLR